MARPQPNLATGKEEMRRRTEIQRALRATGAIAAAIAIVLIVFAQDAKAQIVIPDGVDRSIGLRLEFRDEAGPETASLVNLRNALADEMRRARLEGLSNGAGARLTIPSEVAAITDDPEKNNRRDRGTDRQPLPDHSADQEIWQRDSMHGFQWGAAFKQSLLFLGIQHGFRLATEEGSRADLKGPFFRDYWKSLTSLKGWADGDPFIVNYIGHPMMGAVSGYIQIQNDPKGIDEKLSLKKSYWISRLKAMGWSAAYSTQFELGLVSEATLGNIGIRPYGKAKNPMAYVDLVVTPVVGTGWLVGEDALDQYFISRIERRLPNRTTLVLVRSFLNPTRSFANIMRGKWPWHRDDRQ